MCVRVGGWGGGGAYTASQTTVLHMKRLEAYITDVIQEDWVQLN